MTDTTISTAAAAGRPLEYVSSKGTRYSLYAEDIRLKSGHGRRIYYWTTRPPKPQAIPVSDIPPGHEIGEGRNGLPFLRRSS